MIQLFPVLYEDKTGNELYFIYLNLSDDDPHDKKTQSILYQGRQFQIVPDTSETIG